MYKSTLDIRQSTGSVYQRAPPPTLFNPCPLLSLAFSPVKWVEFNLRCFTVARGPSILCTIMNRRRQWHPTLVLLPGKSHGWRSLEGCSPWGRLGLDTTERLHFQFSLSCIGEGNGNPLQCSCLENPRDGRAWWAAVSGVTQSWTWLKRLSSGSQSWLQVRTPWGKFTRMCQARGQRKRLHEFILRRECVVTTSAQS